MSIQAIAWVLDHSEAQGVDRLVLIALANYVNDDGVCWPSQRTLARQARLSKWAIQNAVKRLSDLGELVVLEPGTARRSARYRLPFVAAEDDDEEGVDSTSPLEGGGLPRESSEDSHRSPDPLRTITSDSLRESPPRDDLSLDLSLLEKETTPVVARAREADAGSVIQQLVAGYVEDVKRFGDGTPPPRQFRAAAGRAVRLALAEGETVAHISACLQVIARERKQPATLPYVLLDSHAGAPRRRPHP